MSSSGAKTTKRPVATNWVTVNDIAVTGVTPVYSDNIIIPISNLPDFINPVVEFQFTHQRTAGAGLAFTWVKVVGHNLLGLTTENTPDPLTYTGRMQVGNTALARRIQIPIHIFQGSNISSVLNILRFNIGSACQDAETSASVANIQARLIYTPL